MERRMMNLARGWNTHIERGVRRDSRRSIDIGEIERGDYVMANTVDRSKYDTT